MRRRERERERKRCRSRRSCQLTGLVSEEDFTGFMERGRILLAVEQMMQHAVDDLFGARLRQVQHQLRLTQEMLHVDVRSNFGRKVFHRDFLQQNMRIARSRDQFIDLFDDSLQHKYRNSLRASAMTSYNVHFIQSSPTR